MILEEEVESAVDGEENRQAVLERVHVGRDLCLQLTADIYIIHVHDHVMKSKT